MGFFTKAGKSVLRNGYKGIKGLGENVISHGGIVGKTVLDRSKSSLAKNAGGIALGTIAAASAGVALAEADGQSSKVTTGLKYGAVGAGASLMVPGVGTAMAAGGIATAGAAAMVGGGLYSMGSKMIKTPSGPITLSNTGDIKPTAFGMFAVTAGALTEGAIRAKNEFYKSRMGAHDGMSRSATPIVPFEQSQAQNSQVNNGGATGDLVFALNNLRKGWM